MSGEDRGRPPAASGKGRGSDAGSGKFADRRQGGKLSGASSGKTGSSVGKANSQPSKRKQASPRELSLDILVKVAKSGAYSNIQLNRSLQESGLSRADAALATELVYGTIGRQATLDYWLGKFVAKGLGKLEVWVHQLLRMSAYQLLFLDRVPAHAVVNEAVTIAKRRGHAGISGMVNGVLRSIDRGRGELTPERIDAPTEVATLAICHSYPEWLVKRWADTYGLETAEAILASGNEHPHASSRANALLGSRDELLRELRENGFEAEPSKLAPAGIIVTGGGNMADTDGFRQGRWSLQDESSMLVAEVVAPKAGMKVLDCCAAPGGKSAHMAELMDGKGKIWANDLHAHKRELIVSQTERLKLRNVEAITGDAAALSGRFAEGSMDAVLLDAPCSGFGVIRRKPEIKWNKTEGDISEIAALQRQLLNEVCGLVRPGGTLVYSTCTIEIEENERQIAAFLSGHPDFELDPDWPETVTSRLRADGLISGNFSGELQILPQHYGSDGFYIARMKKRA